MKLELHPEAKENFNTKIEDIKLKLQFKEPAGLKNKVPNPDTHVVHTFDETNIIGDIKLFWRDDTGRVAARAFGENGRLLGLFDEDYKDLTRIAEGIQKAVSPKNVIGTEGVSELIFEWIKKKYKGEEIPEMVDYVLTESEKEIREFDIWIPISHLLIEAPFNLGKIIFKTITKKMMDDYEEVFLSKVITEEEKHAINFKIGQMRSKMQSFGVATIKVEATPERAYEIALEETERAVDLLRFFSPIILHPNKICYVAPLGKQHMDSDYYFFVKDEKFTHYHSGFSDRAIEHWRLSKTRLNLYMEAGLKILSDLLIQKNLTDFQQKLLDGIFLFSRGILAKNISDRLVYTLVALETIFLKDTSEQIQDSVSLRMAYLKPVAQRKDLISNFKVTYKLRSSIIHHGGNVGVDDLETLRTFMENTWESLNFLIVNLAKTNITREQFFEHLENRRIGA